MAIVGRDFRRKGTTTARGRKAGTQQFSHSSRSFSVNSAHQSLVTPRGGATNLIERSAVHGGTMARVTRFPSVSFLSKAHVRTSVPAPPSLARRSRAPHRQSDWEGHDDEES